MEHVTLSIFSVKHDREDDLWVVGVGSFKHIEVVVIQHISISTVDDRVTVCSTFLPLWLTCITLCVEVKLSEKSKSNRTGHRTIANIVGKLWNTSEELRLDEVIDLFAGVLFYLMNTVINSSITIEVQSEEVVESTKSSSLCYTCPSCLIV